MAKDLAQRTLVPNVDITYALGEDARRWDTIRGRSLTGNQYRAGDAGLLLRAGSSQVSVVEDATDGFYTIDLAAAISNRNQAAFSDSGEHEVAQSENEVVILEWNVIDTTFVNSAVLTAILGALIKRSGTATATVQTRIGGTVGAVDGDVVTGITSTSSAFERKQSVATPYNLTTAPSYSATIGTLVKITLRATGGAASDLATFRGLSQVLSG